MKKPLFVSALAAAVLSLPQIAGAQTFSSAYFLDNYVYQYRLNPSMHPDDNAKSIVGILIGDMTMGLKTNVGASTFLYPKDGELVSAFNSKVSSQEFLGNLPDLTKADLKLDFDFLTVGGKTKHGYVTVDVRLKSFINGTASKDVFKYAKEGFNLNPGASYQISCLDLNSKNFVEVAGAYSMRVKNFKFGIGLKFLLGIASGQTSITDANIYIRDKESGYFSGNTSISLAGPVKYKAQTGSATPLVSANTVIGGYGAAVDLGFYWDTPLKGLSFSASVLDLGSIYWKNNLNASASHNQTAFSTKDEDTKNLTKVINTLYGIDPNNPGSPAWVGLAATINTGLRYKMPFYDKLSVGAHGSFLTGPYSTYDVRLGATVTPVNHVSVTANYGFTTYGGAFGLAANFRLGAIAIFGGIDGLITRFAPQGFPVDAFNTVMKLGVTIAPKTDALKMKKKNKS